MCRPRCRSISAKTIVDESGLYTSVVKMLINSTQAALSIVAHQTNRYLNMPRVFLMKWVTAKAAVVIGLAGLTAALCVVGVVAAADEALPEDKHPYTWSAAVKSIMNPHEQINDEGDVLWGKCIICHTNTPDLNVEKNIKDVSLRFEEDLSEICRRCHTVRPHPSGDEGSADVRMSGFVAPDHMVVPPKMIGLNMRFAQKEKQMMLPLEPKSGKIICSTCHNPHEKGVLHSRADFGADAIFRLRSGTIDVCQSCHRK